MSRLVALAVMESIDHMDPTNSRELKPSQRLRHRGFNWSVLIAWVFLAAMVLFVLAVASVSP